MSLVNREPIEDPAVETRKRVAKEAADKRRKAEEDKKKAEAAKKKAEADKAAAKAKRGQEIRQQERQRLRTDPVNKFIQQNIYRPLMGEEGYKKWEEQAVENRAKQVEASDALEEASYSNPIAAAATDTLRAVVGAPAAILEGVIDKADLLKDTAGVAINRLRGVATPDKDNPFSDRYEASRVELTKAPKTAVGRLGEGLLSFGITMRAVGARLPSGVTGLGTGGKGLKGAVASGIVPGVIADFLLTKPDDKNLANLVQDLPFVPEGLKDSFLFALAIDENDNAWEALLKTMLDGAVTGAAADTLGYILVGRRAAQRALREGKSPEEAMDEGLKAAQEGAELATQASDIRTDLETQKWNVARQDEYQKLVTEYDESAKILDRVASEFGEDSVEFAEALRHHEEVTKSINEFDIQEINRIDPQNMEPHEKAAYTQASDINEAVTRQLKLENGGIPGVARAPSPFRAPSPGTMGGSPTILTDAAYRIMNMEDEAERLVRDLVRQSDLDKVAKSLKRSYKQVVRDAGRIVQEFRDADVKWNDSTMNIEEVLARAGGTTRIIPGNGIEKTILSEEGVVATKALITDTANQILALSQNIDAMREIRLSGGNQMDRLVDRMVGLVKLHKMTGAYHGFNLGAFKQSLWGNITNAREFDPQEAKSVKQLEDWAIKVKRLIRDGDPSAQAEFDAMVRTMVLAGGDPTKTVSFARMGMKIGFENVMKGMYQSILSGPITHLRNLVGNTYSTIERPMSIALSGLMTGDKDQVRSAVAGMHGIVMGLGDAWEIARRSLLTNQPVHINRKFAVEEGEIEATLEVMKLTAKNPGEQAGVGFLEVMYHFFKSPFLDWPSRALMASDEFFKQLNVRQKMYSESMYSALKNTKSPDDVDTVFQNYLKEFSKKIDPKTGEILDENLLEYADMATFQNDPGQFVNAVARVVETFPPAKIFIPFLRTPANMLAYAGQHTPMLNRFTANYKKVMEGSDELLKAEMRGRQAIGAITLGSVALAALDGRITGTGPYDREERTIWERTHRPRSIKMGDKWVSYEAIEPLATLGTIVADIVMIAKMGNIAAAEKLYNQALFSFTAAVTEKSMLAGLAAISELINPMNSGNRFATSAVNTLNNFIPYAGARRALANGLDPYLKEVDNDVQRILASSMPFYKQMLPNRTDIFTGEPIQAIGGGWYNAISPFRIAPANSDPVQTALVDSEFEFNSIITTGPQGEPLTAQEKADLTKYMYESKLYANIKRVTETDWFKKSLKSYREREGEVDKREMLHYIALEREFRAAKQSAYALMRYKPDLAERLEARNKSKLAANRGDAKGAVEALKNLPK